MPQLDRSVTDGPIHQHFGLSYANYLVIPRALLQSMPLAWQRAFVGRLDELHAAFAHVPQAEAYEVIAGTEHAVEEMGFDLLAEAGITEDWFGGVKPPEGLSQDDLHDWKVDNEVNEPTYYDKAGREMDPRERVILPEPDPVPAYNRGRTYIEPRITAPRRPVCPVCQNDPAGCTCFGKTPATGSEQP